MLVIGLLNHNGTIGRALLENLLPHISVAEPKIKVVVFHRPSSRTAHLPRTDNLTIKRLDLLNDSDATLSEEVQGIHIFFSCLTTPAVSQEIRLVKALSDNRDLITFVPSDYSIPWPASFASELEIIQDKISVQEKCKALKVPHTSIKTGIFADQFFALGKCGVNLRANRLEIHGSPSEAMKNPYPLTTVQYLAKTLVHALEDPAQIANQTLSIAEFLPTGQDFLKLLREMNDQEPNIVTMSDIEYSREVAEGPTQSILAGLKTVWGSPGGFVFSTPLICRASDESTLEQARWWKLLRDVARESLSSSD